MWWSLGDWADLVSFSPSIPFSGHPPNPVPARRPPTDLRNWPTIDLMLGQRRRRWPNIKSTLGQRLVLLDKSPSKHETFTQCCFNAGPPSATLAQHRTSIGWTLLFGGSRRSWRRLAVWACPPLDGITCYSDSSMSHKGPIYMRLQNTVCLPGTNLHQMTKHSMFARDQSTCGYKTQYVCQGPIYIRWQNTVCL